MLFNNLLPNMRGVCIYACLGAKTIQDLFTPVGTFVHCWIIYLVLKNILDEPKLVLYTLNHYYSNNAATENKLAGLGVGDGAISSSQSTFGYQSTWGGQGQVSMADIVKMGKPQGKSSSVQNTSLQGASSLNSIPFQSTPSHQNFHSAQHQASTVSEVHSGPGIVSQQASLNDEWPSIESPQPVSISSTIESPAVLELHSNPANLSLDAASQHIHQDKVQVVESGSVDTVDANHAAHASSILGRNIQEDNSGGTSVSDNNLYEDMSSYLPHRHAIEHDEGYFPSPSLFFFFFYCQIVCIKLVLNSTSKYEAFY